MPSARALSRPPARLTAASLNTCSALNANRGRSRRDLAKPDRPRAICRPGFTGPDSPKGNMEQEIQKLDAILESIRKARRAKDWVKTYELTKELQRVSFRIYL